MTTTQSLFRPGLAAKAGLLVVAAALTVQAGESKAQVLAPTDPITINANQVNENSVFTLGDKTWSGFSFGGGFTPLANDKISFTVLSPTQYQIQYLLDPTRNAPISGIFNYSVTILPDFVAAGFLLQAAESNVTGSAAGLGPVGNFQTSVSSSKFDFAGPLSAGSTASGFPSPSLTKPFLPATTTASFSQAFSAANAPSGGNLASISSFGLVVIQNKEFTEKVPGPLPILGAAAAFGFSRKLRRRIGQVA